MSRYGLVAISHPWWRDFDDFLPPARIFDQHFGLGLSADDLLPMNLIQGPYLRPRQVYNRQRSGLSEVQTDANKFKVNLDVNQFSPNELTVKTVDNCVVVHGKHEEKSDEHGFISREFTRRYVLPDDVEPETVSSALSRDGVLTIEAPKKVSELPKPVERTVPIVQQKAPAVAQEAVAQGDGNKVQ